MSSRPYDSALRTEQALVTRARIIDAARRLLLQHGTTGLTIAGLATAADVSPQTIYNAIGGRAAVIKAVYDVTLADDDEPVAMNDRPEFKAMSQAPDAATLLRHYAHLGRLIADRVAPILAVVLTRADDDSRALATTVEGERHRGNATTIGY